MISSSYVDTRGSGVGLKADDLQNGCERTGRGANESGCSASGKGELMAWSCTAPLTSELTRSDSTHCAGCTKPGDTTGQGRDEVEKRQHVPEWFGMFGSQACVRWTLMCLGAGRCHDRVALPVKVLQARLWERRWRIKTIWSRETVCRSY
jgi:hypothetical protein